MRPMIIHLNRKKRCALKLLFAGVILLSAVIWMDSRIRPLVSTISSYQTKLVATRSVNDAVLRILSEENFSYQDIITASRDKDGRVTSLSTNMVTLNRLKAEINNAVSDQLKQDQNQAVEIPLGTLLGGQFFSGRGPKISFCVLPAGYVETRIYNRFESAGINQTLHQIMLSVDTRVSGVLPIYTITTEITTDLCIAETVIVGEVPQSFTDINGDHRALLDQINDYAPS